MLNWFVISLTMFELNTVANRVVIFTSLTYKNLHCSWLIYRLNYYLYKKVIRLAFKNQGSYLDLRISLYLRSIKEGCRTSLFADCARMLKVILWTTEGWKAGSAFALWKKSASQTRTKPLRHRSVILKFIS